MVSFSGESKKIHIEEMEKGYFKPKQYVYCLGFIYYKGQLGIVRKLKVK